MIESNYIKKEHGVLLKQLVRLDLRILLAMVAAAIALSASVYSSTAFAATPNTLKVTPVRTDIEIKPGERKIVKTVVTNLTNQPISVRPYENDFISGDERGTPALILDETKFAPTHSLKRFLSPLSTVTIPANQAKAVEVAITVPKTAQAGGYFGAIRFAPASTEGGGQVNLSASVASLILMTVPGDTVERLELTDFQVQQNGKSGTNFRSPNNLQATVRFENAGNVQIGPIGKVSVTKGDDIVYETDFNDKNPRDVVLPDSARRWDVRLKDIGEFGHYTVSATFTYGKENKTIEVTKSFWVIPMGVIIAAIAGAVLLILLIVGIWFFLRSYKRRIIRNSSNGRRSHRR